MKLSSFSNAVREAFSNISRNKLMTIATLVTLSAGLFLFGLTSALTLNVFSITDKLQSDFKLEAYIDESFDMTDKASLEEALKKVTNVTDIEFLPKEEAFKKFKEEFPQPELLEGIDDGSILRDAYKITLADLSASKETVTALEKVKGIAKVTQLADEMQTFLTIVKKLQLATVIISIILGLLAVLIITNTINMSISFREKQINIMKYVGATDGYIRLPFMLEGITIGIVSAIFAYLSVIYLYNTAVGTMGSQAANIGVLSTNAAFIPLAVIVGAMGVLLGCIGSTISIRKHLNV